MNPIIGIVACGYMDQRQFVPQTYIRAMEDARHHPVILPCTREEEAFPSLWEDLRRLPCSAEAMM